MANHKRRRPKHRRAGCLLCKPSKLTANKKADSAKARRDLQRHEREVWWKPLGVRTDGRGQ